MSTNLVTAQNIQAATPVVQTATKASTIIIAVVLVLVVVIITVIAVSKSKKKQAKSDKFSKSGKSGGGLFSTTTPPIGTGQQTGGSGNDPVTIGPRRPGSK